MRSAAFDSPADVAATGVGTAVLPAPGFGPFTPRPAATGSGITFMQILAIARAYWRQSLLVWALLTVLLVVTLLGMPRIYLATATLVVDDSSGSTLSAQAPPPDQLAAYLAEQVELLTSPALLRPVVLRLNLAGNPEWSGGFRGDPRALPDYVATRLSHSLDIQVSPNDQLVYVSASAATPAEAATIANAVVDQYFAEGRGRAQRYAEQLAELRGRVATAQANLAAFRAQKGVTDISGLSQNSDTDTEALDTLEAKLLEAQNLRRSLEARAVSDPSSSEEALASPQVQQLRSELRSLQTELAQDRTIYGNRHPKIMALESQIAATRRALNGERGTLQTDLSTQLKRAEALESQYSAAVQKQRENVMALRNLQGQGARLELDLQSAQAIYKDALAGYEQAMFSSVDKFTNLRVLNPASPPASSSKTRKRQWFMKGSLAALAFAFALSFAYELLIGRRLRCVDDFERGLGVRVLAQIGSTPPLSHA